MSSNDSSEKLNEQTQENRIRNDEEEETPSKAEPVVADKSGSSNCELTSQLVEDDVGRTKGEGMCALSSDEIKQIVAKFLATVSVESSISGPSVEFTEGKYKSRFYSSSSGKVKKVSAKLSESKSSRSSSKKSKTLHPRGESVESDPLKNVEKSDSAAHASSSKKRRKINKKRFNEDALDVFTKMRKQVRYILNKIKYEQSLIDAYGGEGWKGLSIDKLKPERELQRASSVILQCKLKLRDLFQQIDSLCSEGAYPKSMFDSEGLLDSEDIYCTICNSRELSADNDIVLCDGECNRAFHQLCLKPPLLTEEIPPEDQGWLCPGCDCKFDCTEMLNDVFGSDLSMKDHWTSVFPEAVAAAAAAGFNIVDEILGLPSDDSEDDDFNPDNMDVAEKVEIDRSGEESESCEGDESASDDSDFSSASEDLGDFINKGLLIGNATVNLEDDEEEGDDDYDPDAEDPNSMNIDKKVEIEKIGEVGESQSDESDFSSASEDNEDEEDYDPHVPEPDQQIEGSPYHNTSDSDFSAELDNKILAENGNSEILEQDAELTSNITGSNKRVIERLDYKKLYDDTYGNAGSDSSDDEEWHEADLPQKRKDKIKIVGSTILKNNKRGLENDKDPVDAEIKLQDAEFHTSRRTSKKLKSSSENGSMAKGARNTLGETATQKLSEAFQKNQYPERAVKEGLAKDLGISYQKVDKWFGNARWSHKHPLHVRTVSKSNMATSSPSQTNPVSEVTTPIPNNSSSNHSSPKLSGAKTLVKGTPISISSPLNPTRSATNTTIEGCTSKTPSQPNKRRSARLQGSCTSNASGGESNKGSEDNDISETTNGVENSTQRSKDEAPTPKPKQRGKKVARAKR